MDKQLIIFIATTIIIAIIASIALLVFVFNYKKKQHREAEYGIVYKENVQGEKKTFGIWIFLIVFGLIFDGVGGGMLYLEKNRTLDWEEIPAIITTFYKTSNRNKHSVVKVSYIYDDDLYTDISLNYSSSSMKVGKDISIQVNPNYPEEITINSKDSNQLSYIFVSVGTLISLIGIYNFMVELLEKDSRQNNNILSLDQRFSKRGKFVIVTCRFVFIGLWLYTLFKAGIWFLIFGILFIVVVITLIMKDKKTRILEMELK